MRSSFSIRPNEPALAVETQVRSYGNLPCRCDLSRLLRLYLIICIFIAPMQFYINVGTMAFAIGYIMIVPALMLFLGIISLRRCLTARSGLHLPIVFLLSMVVFSSLRVNHWFDAAVKVMHLILQLLFYLLVSWNFNSERAIGRAIKAIVLCGSLVSIIGIGLYVVINVLGFVSVADMLAHRWASFLYGYRGAQLFAGGRYYSWVRPVPGQIHHAFRATSLFITPGENALFSTCVFFIVVGLIEHSPRRKRPILGLAVLLLTLNILLSQVRGVYMGLCAGLLYYAFASRICLRPQRLAALSTITATALVVVVALVGAQDVVAQVQSIFTRTDSSSLSRLGTMQHGLEIVVYETPLVGLGPGNHFSALGLQSGSIGGTTHSMYLDLAIQLGGLGLLGFFWLMTASWREASRVRNSASPTLRALATGYQPMWVALMVTYVVQGNFFGNPKTNLVIWGLVGLVSAARQQYQRRIGV